MTCRLGRIWLILTRVPGTCRRIKAEPPCMKGEVMWISPVFRLVVGWQRKKLSCQEILAYCSKEKENHAV
jgi:hypothetical protein